MSTRRIAGFILCVAFSMGMTQAVVRDNNSDAPKIINENLDRSGWVLTASEYKDENQVPQKALDGMPMSRWTTGNSQKGGEWLMLDLQMPQKFDVIDLDQNKSPNDYPRGYEVYVSKDGTDWGKAIVTGEGTNGGATVITLPKVVKTRYVKIVQTGKAGNYWSVCEINLKKN